MSWLLDILKNRIFIHQIICMKFSRYTAVITSFSSHRLLTVLSVIRNFNLLKPLITGKTSYHNSTSLLIGLTPVSRSSPFTVLFPTELTYRCLFLYEQVPTCFFLWSGAHLLSHIVSNAVPSAAQVLTVVFGMGTGVSPKRIDTGSFIYLARYFRA